jgi:enoyl-[acyl-carrier protein] reductase II
METALTRLFGIEHPVILPGMSWISKAELVAAVSEAGGLGILAAGPLRPDETRAAIQEIRKRTDKPFGVGFTLMMPGAVENGRIALEERVPVINFALGRGEWLIEGAHSYGGKTLSTVTSVKHAISAQAAGTDAVLATGFEAAAHGEEVTSLVLVRAAAHALEIPVVGAGGFADGHGLAAALSLGAAGIAMGTRFAATRESAMHLRMKETIVGKQTDETIRTNNFDGMYARLMTTPRSLQVTRRPLSFVEASLRALRNARELGMPLRPIFRRLVSEPERIRLLAYFGASVSMAEAATIHGDVENGVQFIGQSQGLVDDIPSAGDVVRRVVAEAHEVLSELARS